MSADYYNGRVSLNVDFDSARKTFVDKVSKFWFHIVVIVIFIILTSWLIVLTLSTGIKKLNGENKSLREIIELNQKTIAANAKKIEALEAKQKEDLESIKTEKASKDELSNLSMNYQSLKLITKQSKRKSTE